MWKSVLVALSNWVCMCVVLSLSSVLLPGDIGLCLCGVPGQMVPRLAVSGHFPYWFLQVSLPERISRSGGGADGEMEDVRQDTVSITQMYIRRYKWLWLNVETHLIADPRGLKRVRCCGTQPSPVSCSLGGEVCRGTRRAGKKKQVCALVLLHGGLRAGVSLPGSVAQLGCVSSDDWFITPSRG